MSSGMNVKGFPTYGVYAATKAAIRSFGRTWAAELIGRGIRVNVLSPGVIDTPILAKQFSTDAELQAGTDGFTSLIPAGGSVAPRRSPTASTTWSATRAATPPDSTSSSTAEWWRSDQRRYHTTSFQPNPALPERNPS